MWSPYFNSAINLVPASNLYPDAPGGSLGQVAGAATPYSMGPTQEPLNGTGTGDSPTDADMPTGFLGQPLTAWGTFLVLFLVIGWVGHKTGEPSGMGNLKLSGYNVLYIGLASILVIGAFKVIFTRFKVPGFTTLIQAV